MADKRSKGSGSSTSRATSDSDGPSDQSPSNRGPKMNGLAANQPKKDRSAPSGRSTSAGGSSSKQTSSAKRETPSPTERADVGEIARAVSTGFTILVLGGLIQPVVTKFVPVLGVIWLVLIAVVAFGWAGYRSGAAAPKPLLYGGGAALLAYGLVVPLLFLQGTFQPMYALYTVLTAAVVGVVAGYVGGRLRPDN